MRPVLAFVVVLVGLLSPIVAIAQTLEPKEIENFSKLTVVERAYILKTAENLLMPNVKKMADDPENKKDGYLWSSKVTALWYVSLSRDADSLQIPTLSRLYKEKADLIVMRIRGKISPQELESGEIEIEQNKLLFLESLLPDAPKRPTIPIPELTVAAELIAKKTHGLSVLAASK